MREISWMKSWGKSRHTGPMYHCHHTCNFWHGKLVEAQDKELRQLSALLKQEKELLQSLKESTSFRTPEAWRACSNTYYAHYTTSLATNDDKNTVGHISGWSHQCCAGDYKYKMGCCVTHVPSLQSFPGHSSSLILWGNFGRWRGNSFACWESLQGPVCQRWQKGV